MSTPVLKRIPLASIRENPVALRSVNRQSPKYIEMAGSIKAKGVYNPILVRPLPSDNGEELFGLVEGLHRYTGSLDAGLTDIPAQIMDLNDAEVEEAQIIGNLHKVETKGYEYSSHLERLLARNPTQTIASLADRIKVNPEWLRERLKLANLEDAIGKMVDAGQINVTNGIALAKLPKEEQQAFVERAMTMSPSEFVPTAAARKKELDTAKRAGRVVSDEFVPVPHAQSVGDIKNEMASPQIGPLLCRENNLTTAEQGFAMAIKWAVHMDPRSIEVDKAKEEERKKKAKDTQVKAAAERTKKKADAAAAAAAELAAK